MENKLSIVYSQLFEILKYIPTNEFKKIPDEIIKKIQFQSNCNYEFRYNPKKTFKEQGVLEETRTMLSIIYRDYLADEEEKNRIKRKEYNERIENDKIAKEKYNADNIFENRKVIKDTMKDSENNLPKEIKCKNFLQKILNFIRKLWS